MGKRLRTLAAILTVVLHLPLGASDGSAASLPLDRLNLPPGFAIDTYARVAGARSMAVLDNWGAILVGTRGDSIYAAIDADRDHKAERVVELFSDLKVANGIDWKDGWFYVAEQHRIVRYRAPDLETLAKAEPEVLYDNLPDDRWHGWRYARFGPDEKLYVSVGVPCNICRPNGLEGTIIRIAPKGGEPEIVASGIRNSVGIGFHPRTGDLYFTDNGADHMGDDSPPEEFNHAPSTGLWFGYPNFGGGDHRTRNFGAGKQPKSPTFPVVTFGAHVAPLGFSFVPGGQLPAAYEGDVVLAQHGSWNRTVPDGYRLVRVKFNGGSTPVGQETFIDGWLGEDGEVWGRPVDVKPMADGSLLVSDDHADAIYRITYTGQ